MVNLVIGIVKVKVLAVLLGPAGVGLMGLYQNIMGMGSTLAGCGLGSSGVRQLAASAGEAATLALVRRALWTGNLVLGVAGMAILWLLREPVAIWVFGDAEHVYEVGWLGIGVLLTLIAGSQTALLQGLRRIGDLARASIFGALFSAAAGILLVYLLGQAGVLWFVLVAPGISVLVAAYYAARLPRVESLGDWQAIARQWRAMLELGIPLMAAGLMTLATQLAVRSLILRELGLEASGHFQAAWAISMTYIGFVLGAMGTDYFPRLTEAVNDHARARKLVDEQIEMALLLAGPVLLVMITLAPWVIQLLYADGFAPAAEVLRWQVMGDILKVGGWAIGFIVLAMGRGGIFIATQLNWNVVYFGVVFLGMNEWGLNIAGYGFCIAYLVQYGVVSIVGFRLIGYKNTQYIFAHTLFLLIIGVTVIYLSKQSLLVSAIVGVVVASGVSVYSLKRINKFMDVTSFVRKGWLKLSAR